MAKIRMFEFYIRGRHNERLCFADNHLVSFRNISTPGKAPKVLEHVEIQLSTGVLYLIDMTMENFKAELLRQARDQ